MGDNRNKCSRETKEDYCFGFSSFASAFSSHSNAWGNVDVHYPTATADGGCPKPDDDGYNKKHQNVKTITIFGTSFDEG